MKIHLFTSPGRQPMSRLSIQSALNQGERVCLWFNDRENTDQCLLNEFGNVVSVHYASDELENYLPWDEAIKQYQSMKEGSIAPYTDVLRLEMIHRFGGWWADDDLIFLRPITTSKLLRLADNQDFIAASDITFHTRNKYQAALPSNYLMGTNANSSETALKLLNDAKSINAKNVESGRTAGYIEIGPLLLAKRAHLYNLDIMPLSFAASIASVKEASYKRHMTKESFIDLMFLKDAVAVHYTNIPFGSVDDTSILGLLLQYVEDKETKLLFNLLYQYYQNTFGEEVFEHVNNLPSSLHSVFK